MAFPSNPKSRILDSLRKPTGFKLGTPSKSINRNPINRPNPNPGVGDNNRFPGNLSPQQPKSGGGYTFPGNLSPQQPGTKLPPIGKESNLEFPKTKLPPIGKESNLEFPKTKLPPGIPDKPTKPGWGSGMIKLDPRENGEFNEKPPGTHPGGDYYFPGFPSTPNDGMIQLDPREWNGEFNQPNLDIPPGHIGGGDYYYPGIPSQPQQPSQPPGRTPLLPGMPSQPGKPGISPDPVRKDGGKPMQKNDQTGRFVMDALNKGFDPKMILQFLSRKTKK